MPMTLSGSCRCGAISFTCDSHTPVPYGLCYCTICRKTGGGGGYAINLGGIASTLKVQAEDGALGVYSAQIKDADGTCHTSIGQRNYCTRCASALWVYAPDWPELVHPFASAIDSPLPVAPARVHIMLAFKPDWVVPEQRPEDSYYDG